VLSINFILQTKILLGFLDKLLNFVNNRHLDHNIIRIKVFKA